MSFSIYKENEVALRKSGDLPSRKKIRLASICQKMKLSSVKKITTQLHKVGTMWEISFAKVSYLLQKMKTNFRFAGIFSTMIQ
jgi:hypothetical protein